MGDPETSGDSETETDLVELFLAIMKSWTKSG
jgi:hypothetical protein